MYTDVCSIQPISRDADFGNETKGTAFETKCREEQYDKIKKHQTGSSAGFNRLYILPAQTSISKGDRIKTTKRRGSTVSDIYVNVDEVFFLGRFKPHHIEVTVYSV